MKSWYSLAIIRMLSALGSLITGSTILLYLVEHNRQNEAPLNSAATALGALFATRILMPAMLAKSTRGILIAVEVFGFFVTLSVPILLMLGISNEIPEIAFLAFSFVASAVGVIGTSVSFSSYVSHFKNPNAMNWDSSLQILGRVLAPGLAASLLAATNGNISTALVIDSLSYALSAIAFGLLLEKSPAPHAETTADKFSPSFLSMFLSRPTFWVTAIAVTFGAGAYNAGALIILKERGFDLNSIALFMTVQNLAMVSASLAGAKFGSINQRFASAMAAVGLAVFGCASSNFTLACIGVVTMAAGMIPLLQSLRLQVSKVDNSQAQTRMEQSFFALISSVSGITGMLFFQLLALLYNWESAALLGSTLLLFPLLLWIKNFFRKPVNRIEGEYENR